MRTYVLSTDRARWRIGVILTFEGNCALVRTETLEKRVFIAVRGPVAGRRHLLAVIRSDFDRIHRKFEPQELVPIPDHLDVAIHYRDLYVMKQSGIRIFLKVVGTQVISLDVKELLDGVDLEGARTLAPSKESLGRTPRPLLFYRYSHQDDELREELVTRLKLFERQSLIKS